MAETGMDFKFEICDLRFQRVKLGDLDVKLVDASLRILGTSETVGSAAWFGSQI